ncbi:MAG TPA: hypothetical protein VIT91_08245 [Chthoniobacterales bacterium]
MRHLIALLPLACVFSACTATRPAPPAQAGHLNRAEVLSHISAQPAGVTFVSRNGRMYGMDSDARITLTRNNKTEVMEAGYTPETYNGTYSVDASGAIHVSLRRYPSKWPSMYLYTDKRGAILHPTDQDPSFRMGGRAGAVTSSDMAPYWPFRQTK